MTDLTAGFETGTNGNNVKTSDTGDATAFDVAFDDGHVKYDNAHTIDGSLAGKITASAGQDAPIGWTTAFGTKTDHYGRVFLYYSPLGSAGNARGLIATKTTWHDDFFINVWDNNDGTAFLFMHDNTGQTNAATTFPVSTFVRIEYHVVHSTSTGSWEVRIYNTPSSGTPTETITPSSNGSRDTGTNATSIYMGVAAAGGSAFTGWLDKIVAGAATWPGPLAAPPTPPYANVTITA